MKNYRCHIASLLFLVFLALPPACLLLLQGLQCSLQTTASLRMKAYTMETVILPANKVVWQKKGKELNLQGRLFDVKSYRVENGLLTATGYYDEKETAVVDLLQHLANPGKSQVLLQFLLVLQCFVLLPLIFSIFPEISRLQHQSGLSLFFPAPYRLIAEKPPKR